VLRSPVNPFGTNNCNGLFSSDAVWQMQKGFRQALAKVDGAIDFRQFDNDGPDLIPNSGDDDGYVDMIMFAYPTKDGACGGIGGGTAASNNHIWSHRFVLVDSLGLAYRDYITNDVSAKPGFGHIRISDYFTTTALGGASACDSTQIMPIGTAAHEFGHALGLPICTPRRVPPRASASGADGLGQLLEPPQPVADGSVVAE